MIYKLEDGTQVKISEINLMFRDVTSDEFTITLIGNVLVCVSEFDYLNLLKLFKEDCGDDLFKHIMVDNLRINCDKITEIRFVDNHYELIISEAQKLILSIDEYERYDRLLEMMEEQ